MVDPEARLTPDAILQHPWIVGNGALNIDFPEVFADKLKEFNARRRLKKAGNMVMAANRFKNILKNESTLNHYYLSF